MKVHIVCKGKPIVEIQQLALALEARDVEVVLIDPVLSLADLKDEQFWSQVLDCDLLYYRTGFGDAARSELARQLESVKIVVPNLSMVKNVLLSNKIYQNIQVQNLGIRVPKTLIGRHAYEQAVSELGEKFIMKAANGIQGSKVFLVSSSEQYSFHCKQLSGDVLLQEMVPNTGDYRVFVLGGKVHNIFKRVPPEGDFRANVSQGGHGEVVTDMGLRKELGDIALKIAQTLELDITGIDLIISEETGDIYFLEANVNPGWKGLDAALGTDTSGVIADWMLTLTKPI